MRSGHSYGLGPRQKTLAEGLDPRAVHVSQHVEMWSQIQTPVLLRLVDLVQMLYVYVLVVRGTC